MPIPTEGSWPPAEHTVAYQSYTDWDAWYSGDPDRLRDVYAGRGGTEQGVRPSQRRYPGQQAGGVVGRFSRWLWGAPQTPGVTDGRLHVPMPSDLSAAAANLLFSEPPKLTANDSGVMARLGQLAEDGLAQTLLNAAEAASAMGDVYLRPVIDRDVMPDRAFLAVVHADGALPVIRWGKLVEVTFWSMIAANGHKIVRLLEHHEPGRIVWALHEGDRDRLGRPVPMAEYAATEYLADLVDADGAQLTGLDRLDVVRVPNAGPQRQWRTYGPLKYHGRSDYSGAEPLFDRVDEVWTSWMLDVRNGRGRLIVPDYMLNDLGRGQGAQWDPYREVFHGVNAAPGEAAQITAAQFTIRWQEHKATIDALWEAALRHAGLSAQTLGDAGGDVAMTATESQARERQSFITRGNRIQSWRPAIADVSELLLQVERANGLGNGADPVKPSVEFGDSVSESPEATARTLQLLDAAGAVSTDTKVRLIHPDWDDKQVAAEVELIQGPLLADPQV